MSGWYNEGMGERPSDLPPLPPGYERDGGLGEDQRGEPMSPHESMLDYARGMGFDETLAASPLVWRRFRDRALGSRALRAMCRKVHRPGPRTLVPGLAI